MKHLTSITNILVILVIVVFCILSVKRVYEHFTDQTNEYPASQYQYQYKLLSPLTVSSVDGKQKNTPVHINCIEIPDIQENTSTGTNSQTKTKPEPYDPKTLTVPQAKELCNQNDDCTFFTCAPVSLSSNSSDCMNTGDCEKYNKCSESKWYKEDELQTSEFTNILGTEQYIKNTNWMIMKQEHT